MKVQAITVNCKAFKVLLSYKLRSIGSKIDKYGFKRLSNL